MGKITFSKIGGLGCSESTRTEYDNEINYELLEYKLFNIEKAICKNKSDYVCFVFGMGGQPKIKYLSFRKYSGVELVWFGSILPKPLRFFSRLIASHAGLLKVKDIKCLSVVFLSLVEQSMAGIYVFPKHFEERFINTVKNNPTPQDYDFGIKQNDDYFYYFIDADNYESNTGVYEVVSYGVNAKFISEIL